MSQRLDVLTLFSVSVTSPQFAFHLCINPWQISRVDRHIKSIEFIRMVSGAGVLVLLLAWESAAPFLPLFRANPRVRFVHAARNFLMGALNIILTGATSAMLWLLAATWAAQHRFGLLNWLGLTPWLHALAAIILFDLWMYWWHRANHRLPFFWRFHRTHHSDPKMD